MTSQLNAGFFDKYGPIFEASVKNFAFFTRFMKDYAIVEIICGTGSINMWI